MKFKEQIKCKGHEGRVEGAYCKLCETDHTMTFELYKKKTKEALSKYSKLNNKLVKSFQSMEEAQQLNDAWNTMIDELGIK